MDIIVYNNILDGMVAYNNKLPKNYGNTIVGVPPIEPTYPITIFDEIRNVAVRGYNTCYDRLSSNGYRVDIFAQDKGTKYKKQDIARSLAQELDNYLTNVVGLSRVSFNVSNLERNGDVYHIIMTYEGTLHENRRKFI